MSFVHKVVLWMMQRRGYLVTEQKAEFYSHFEGRKGSGRWDLMLTPDSRLPDLGSNVGPREISRLT